MLMKAYKAVQVCVISTCFVHCVQKKTPTRFLLYLRGICSNFSKIFRECLGGNKHSTHEKVRYFLLLVMSC